MFTGLVEELGQIAALLPSPGGGGKLKIEAQLVLEDIALGDSIAVNGTCLTAVEWDQKAGWVLFDAVAETLNETTLKNLSAGSTVNL